MNEGDLIELMLEATARRFGERLADAVGQDRDKAMPMAALFADQLRAVRLGAMYEPTPEPESKPEPVVTFGGPETEPPGVTFEELAASVPRYFGAEPPAPAYRRGWDKSGRDWAATRSEYWSAEQIEGA